MKDKIIEFLKSEHKEIMVEFRPLGEYDDLIQSIGFTYETYETNGWEVDFWYYANHDEYGRISLSGSFWRGNFLLTKQETNPFL